MPLSDKDQTCLDFRLATSPHASIFAYDLPSGRVHHFNLRAPHRELIVRAEALVLTYRHNPFTQLQLVSDDTGFYKRQDVWRQYCEYLQPTRRVPLSPDTDRIATVARRQAGQGTASFLISLTRQLHRAFAYTPGATTVNTSLQQVLENKQGVCQDFAHLMLSVCRRQGIPARYVSGYLYTGQKLPSRQTIPTDMAADRSDDRTSETPERSSDDYTSVSSGSQISACQAPPSGQVTGASSISSSTSSSISSSTSASTAANSTNIDGVERLAGQSEAENANAGHGDFTNGLVGGNAMHAWVECLLPDDKWHGFDPTNNIVTNDHYIKVHHGLDYGSVPPIRGLYHGPFAHNLEVAVQVYREIERE